jgi:hypothetical protein
MYVGTAANAGSGMVLGRESIGFVAGISPNIGGGLSTSVAVQGAVVLHLILSQIPR